MARRISDYLNAVNKAAHSARGKDVLLYLMFVCVAFVFWVLLSLDSEVQRDYDVPVQLEELPDSVTMLGKLPATINVSVQGKGSQFLRYLWGKMPVMKIKFSENVRDHNEFALSRQKIEGRLRDYFGQGVMIASIRPDSVTLNFTSAPGVSLPLHVNAAVSAALGYTVTSEPVANVDSVRAFGINGVPNTLRVVVTEPLNRSQLTDTGRFEVRLKPIEGIRLIPDRVIVTVPVEPLIAKRTKVNLDVINEPAGERLITFPSQVEVSFLVPMSAYSDDFPCHAYVDYDNMRPHRQHLPVRLSTMPSACRNISVSPDSVEYIIERTHQP